MNNISIDFLQRLIEVSKKKYVLLKDIHKLTQVQTEVISGSDIEKLEELIKGKQGSIDSISKLDEEFGIYFKRLKQTLGVESLDEIKDIEIQGVKELRTVIGDIMTLLREISELEVNNNKSAKRLLEDIGDNIKKINAGHKANSIYNTAYNVETPSYFIDKKK